MTCSSSQVLIRKLDEDDVDQFWPLRLRALKEEPHSFGAAYEEAVNMPWEDILRRMHHTADAFILGAFSGEKLRGIVGLYRGQGVKVRHKGHIWGMYVASEARGQGVAKELMLDLIRHSKKLSGIEILLLSVGTANLAARRLYSALGFGIYGMEAAALKIDTIYLDEEMMSLDVRAPKI